MVRYKMVGRDVDSIPTQYRTWVVNDQPDFTGELYTGLKSGDNSLVDISAYLVADDFAIVDFNLPNPLEWASTQKVLPDAVADSQLAILDGYAYLFGGKISDKIYRADINNPADWEDTGAHLPIPLYGSQLAIIEDRIYLFGGNDGYATDVILSATTADPLTWNNYGSLLPRKLYNAQLGIIDGYVYLFGGYDGYTGNTILKASTDDPFTWEDTGSTLPDHLYGSHLGVVDGYMYLFGGLISPSNPTINIYKASVDNPTSWSLAYYLPFPICFGQFVTVGTKGYLFTAGDAAFTPRSTFTKILRCDLTNPLYWIDMQRVVPGEVTQSQLAIIYDRLFLFGGSGSSVIFANAPILKFDFNSAGAVAYGSVTRTEFDATDPLDLFEVLGFPYWKTNYGG
jgi:hypothetical protein